MSNNNKKSHIPFASRIQLAICVALCPLCIIAYTLIDEFTEMEPIFSATLISALYLTLVAIISIYRAKHADVILSEELQSLLDERSSIVIKNSITPMLFTDSYGTIIWYNRAMAEIIDSKGNFIGSNVTALFENSITTEIFSGKPVTLFDRLYRIEGYELTKDGKGIYLAAFTDITELSDLRKSYNDERVAVAYIAIDNAEDIQLYVHEKFKDAVSSVDNTIKTWAKSMNAILKSYDNEKYIMMFDSSKLDECIANRFEILDKIRSTRVGDGVSITASMGISKINGTLEEREAAAREAIDMALLRGGDQVAYKTETSVEYYGGKTKSLYKRSNAKSRTFANRLCSLIGRADNVIIMGHRYGDFDSLGASVGVVRLATLLGIKANIAVDMRDRNLQPYIERMQECKEYSQVFVDSAEAFDLITPDTLAVLVDHSKFDRSQFSEICEIVNNVVIIDHHRKSDAMPEKVVLSYIEPSASSTCELVSEMLETSVASQNILKEEADMLLSGILLDTKQFTRNTGTRTFGAAQYLRNAGANPTDVYDMFKASPKDLAMESRFHTSIMLYKNNIAIASCDGENDESYRIIASKAADKMLTLQNIDAAFALVSIGDQIHISGRSNGKINVQLILEKCGGGGHFEIAGAQIKSDSIISVLETLKGSIDDYLELNNEI